MSLMDAPMALIDRVLGRRDVRADDPVVRRVAEMLAQLAPDPLFEQRLRAETINRYLEAVERPRSRRVRREMGRLGRAVLYASFALTVSVTAVGAAAQQSLPGEVLYGVKLRLEEIRIQIAPATLRPQLLAVELQARLAEAEQLARRGDWTGVERASLMVDRAAAQLAALGLGDATPGLGGLERHAQVLAQLAEHAPPQAQGGLERAIEASSAAVGGDHSAKGQVPQGDGATSGNGQQNRAGGANAGDTTPDQDSGSPDSVSNAGGQAGDHTSVADPSPAPHDPH